MVRKFCLTRNQNNKYEQEIKPEVYIPNGKKILFNQEPKIKILTPTKMVIAFNFKKEAEPSHLNNFLGENVELGIHLYEKKTGRHLSNYNLLTTCNTPPLPLTKEKIIYKENKDEYVITLPRNEGKHQDLRDVKFLLSSDYQNENIKPRIVSIKDDDEQGLEVRFVIKGTEDWQLKRPFGPRNIKAVVYDKAGLGSNETGGLATRFLTAITLVHPYIKVPIGKAEDEGIPIPQIKELQDFFSGEDWKVAGYTVEYSGSGFTYNDQKKKFIKDVAVGIGEYTITVTLKQNGGNPVSTTYNVEIVAKNDVGINQRNLNVIDKTDYAILSPNFSCKSLNLLGQTIQFTGNSPAPKTGRLIVPYTGFETKLRVHIEAISTEGKVKNESEIGENNNEDFDVELKAGSGETATLTFFILAEDRLNKQKYIITFEREASVKVELKLAHKLLTPSDHNGIVSMTWGYGKKEIKSSDSTLEKDMRVAISSEVLFKVNAGEDAIVDSCHSNPSSSSIAIAGSGGEASVTATQDFKMEVTLRAGASVLWKDYKKPENKCGYTSGKITFYKNNAEQPPINLANVTQDERRAVQKGKPCTLKVEGLKGNFIIQSWIVNNVPIQESNSSYALSENNKSFTILKADGDYTIEVETIRLCTLTIKLLRKETDGTTTPITSENAKYSFRANKNMQNGEVIEQDPSNKLKFIKIPMYSNVFITATRETGSNYKILTWEFEKDGTTGSLANVNSDINVVQINVNADTVVKVVLQ